MDDRDISRLLDCEISFEQALDSDIGGDSDAEDVLVTPVQSRTEGSHYCPRNSIVDLHTSTPLKANSTEESAGPGIFKDYSQNNKGTLSPIRRIEPLISSAQSNCSVSNQTNDPTPVPSSSGLGISRPSRKRKVVNKDIDFFSSDSDIVFDSDEDPEYIFNPNRTINNKTKKRFPLIYCTDRESSDEELNYYRPKNLLLVTNAENSPSLQTDNSSKPCNKKATNNKRPPLAATKVNNVPNLPKKCRSKPKKKEKKYKWNKTAKDPQKFKSYNYNQKFGLNVTLPSHEPCDIFKLIFDDDICNTIVEQSNLYALQQNTQLDLTLLELRAFFGIVIFMGFHELPSMKHYWSDDENFHVERVSKVMPVKRFLKILRYLHVNDNSQMPTKDAPDFDKLYKIRPLMNHLKTKYLVLFSPSRNLAVDESMVAFKGRTTLKQYMPKKPIKRGFKIWVCACSETGFVLTFDVYTGKKPDGSSEEGLGERVVTQLTTPFLGTGRCIYFDNFFSSVSLVSKLLEEDTFCCGTILSNRSEYPIEELRLDKDIPTHQHDFAQYEDISVVKWADRGKKCVSVISSTCNPSKTTQVMRSNGKGEKEYVTCPEAIAYYNNFMGGVDRFDQNMAVYNIAQKSRRWWFKLFYFFLESAIVNSYTLYVQDCKSVNNKPKPMSQLKFRSKLVNQLIGTYSSRKKTGYTPGKTKARKRNCPSGRGTVENATRLYNVGDHLPQLVAKYRRCAHCSTKAKEKRSNMVCQKCDVALCKGCFFVFHQQM